VSLLSTGLNLLSSDHSSRGVLCEIHDVLCRDWPDVLCVIRTATRVEPNRTESDSLSNAQLYGRSVYTSSNILTA